MPRLIDHAYRRTQLVDAAWDLISREGLSAASIRRVAERAAVVPGSLRHVLPDQEALQVAILDALVSRLRAGVAKRAAVYARTDMASARLVASLPLIAEQRAMWRVERALRFEGSPSPRLGAHLVACREVRAAECHEVLTALADGLDVSPTTFEFEVSRTIALIEGLGGQLCDRHDEADMSDRARSILDYHLRGVHLNWRNAAAAGRRRMTR